MRRHSSELVGNAHGQCMVFSESFLGLTVIVGKNIAKLSSSQWTGSSQSAVVIVQKDFIEPSDCLKNCVWHSNDQLIGGVMMTFSSSVTDVTVWWWHRMTMLDWSSKFLQCPKQVPNQSQPFHWVETQLQERNSQVLVQLTVSPSWFCLHSCFLNLSPVTVALVCHFWNTFGAFGHLAFRSCDRILSGHN